MLRHRNKKNSVGSYQFIIKNWPPWLAKKENSLHEIIQNGQKHLQAFKLYNNKYMIASTKITNTEIAFIALLVFKLLSTNVLFIIQIVKKKLSKRRVCFCENSKFHG